MKQKYLPDDGRLVLEIVTEKVEQKKKEYEDKLRRLNLPDENKIIYMKSCALSDEVKLEITKRDPSNKLLKEKDPYLRQLTSKCLTLNGFVRESSHNHKPTVKLRW